MVQQSERILNVVEWPNSQVNWKLEIHAHQLLKWNECIIKAWANKLMALSWLTTIADKQT